MRYFAIGMAFAICVLNPASSWSQTSVKKNELTVGDIVKKDFEMYFAGLVMGVNGTNMYLQVNSGEKYYCAPDNITLVKEQYYSIFKKYLKTRPDHTADPIAVAGAHFFDAMIEAFPCPK